MMDLVHPSFHPPKEEAPECMQKQSQQLSTGTLINLKWMFKKLPSWTTPNSNLQLPFLKGKGSGEFFKSSLWRSRVFQLVLGHAAGGDSDRVLFQPCFRVELRVEVLCKRSVTEDEPTKDSNVHHTLRTRPFKVLLMAIHTLMQVSPVGLGD